MGVLLVDETTAETIPLREPLLRKWDTVSYKWHERGPHGLTVVTLTGVVCDLRTRRGERQIRVLGHGGWFPASRVVRVHEQQEDSNDTD